VVRVLDAVGHGAAVGVGVGRVRRGGAAVGVGEELVGVGVVPLGLGQAVLLAVAEVVVVGVPVVGVGLALVDLAVAVVVLGAVEQAVVVAVVVQRVGRGGRVRVGLEAAVGVVPLGRGQAGLQPVVETTPTAAMAAAMTITSRVRPVLSARKLTSGPATRSPTGNAAMTRPMTVPLAPRSFSTPDSTGISAPPAP